MSLAPTCVHNRINDGRKFLSVSVIMALTIFTDMRKSLTSDALRSDFRHLTILYISIETHVLFISASAYGAAESG